jgi:hypothetical protein
MLACLPLAALLWALTAAGAQPVGPEGAEPARPVEGTEASPSALPAIANEFIRIRVNPGPKEAGRFAVDTTGGDPSRTTDDEQILIYGSREPWTSYTTILIDDMPYVFGGPTERRAGLGAPITGLVRRPEVGDDRITCRARVADVEITQDLSFARNPTTRVRDAAHISYTVTNTGDRPHSIGLRVVLDTMLGSNDGAPLRAGDRAIATAMQMYGADIPEYWQAFDSLSEPAVISQGTLQAPGLTPPDHVEMVDWGTLADAPWEYRFPTGSDFTRRGEEAQDTAVALYWHALSLRPGESRTHATLYGVGGVTLSPAELSLGLTAPAEVDFRYDEERAFSVVAYVENSGGFEARRVSLRLNLSEGLKLVAGRSSAPLGLLQPGQTKQSVWRVAPTGAATGTLQISTTVTSENLEPNRVARDIVVNSPPHLIVRLEAPKSLSVTETNRHHPNPFPVRAAVTNRGAQPGRTVVAALTLPDGLELAGGSDATLVVDRIEPDRTIGFNWSIRALGLPTGRLPVSVKVTAGGARPATAHTRVDVPRLTPEIRVHPADQAVPELTDGEPTLVPVSVKLVPARDFHGAEVSLSYDPDVIDVLYVSRGEAFVEGGRLLSPWSKGRIEPGIIAGIGGAREGAEALNVAEVNLFTVVFMVEAAGETDIALEVASVRSSDGTEIKRRAVGGHVIVQSTEGIE